MDQIPGRFPPPPEPDWRSSPQTGPYPLDLGRLMELTFSLFRFRWRLFVATSLIVMVPVWLVLAGADLVAGDATDWLAAISAINAGTAPDIAFADVWASLAVNVAVGAVSGIGVYVASGAVTSAAAVLYAGGRPSARPSIRGALSRLATFTGMWLLILLAELALVALGVFVGSALFLATSNGGRVIPGPTVFLGLIVFVATFAAIVFIAIRWTLAVPVVMLESAGPVTALRRSWKLVGGSSWRVLGYVLLFAVVLGLIAGLLGAVITVALNPVRMVGLTVVSVDPTRLAISTFLSGLISSTLTPISVIAMTLLFFDLRWRKGEQVPVPGEVPQPTRADAPPVEGGSVSE